MNPYKFLFVTCVNNEELYRVCVDHIQKLIIPPKYSIELFPIRNAVSMAEGYNRALTNDAKYKIYLHQDTFIIHPHFIQDILKIFLSSPLLGVLGLLGVKKLPPCGDGQNAEEKIGKLILYNSYYNHYYRLVEYNEVHKPFESVEMVDGFMMATQYDIPWRADLFTGFHFYDVSQCQEFIMRGLTVGIARQLSPWCVHFMEHKTDTIKFSQYQQIFLQHYKNTQ